MRGLISTYNLSKALLVPGSSSATASTMNITIDICQRNGPPCGNKPVRGR